MESYRASDMVRLRAKVIAVPAAAELMWHGCTTMTYGLYEAKQGRTFNCPPGATRKKQRDRWSIREIYLYILVPTPCRSSFYTFNTLCACASLILHLFRWALSAFLWFTLRSSFPSSASRDLPIYLWLWESIAQLSSTDIMHLGSTRKGRHVFL